MRDFFKYTQLYSAKYCRKKLNKFPSNLGVQKYKIDNIYYYIITQSCKKVLISRSNMWIILTNEVSLWSPCSFLPQGRDSPEVFCGSRVLLLICYYCYPPEHLFWWEMMVVVVVMMISKLENTNLTVTSKLSRASQSPNLSLPSPSSPW